MATTAQDAAIKTGATMDVVSGIANIGMGVWNTLFQQGQVKDQAEFERSLSLLTNQQQQQLNWALLNAKTSQDQLAALQGALVQMQIAKMNAGGSNSDTLLIIAAVVLAIAVMYFKMNK